MGKGEGFRSALIRGHWHGEALAGCLEAQYPTYNWLGVHVQLSQVGPKLELESEIREAVSC